MFMKSKHCLPFKRSFCSDIFSTKNYKAKLLLEKNAQKTFIQNVDDEIFGEIDTRRRRLPMLGKV